VAKKPKFMTVEIAEIDPQGRGVTRVDDRTVRVKAALPGERLDVRVVGKRGGEFMAVPHQWQVASPRREASPCAWFERCGGCWLQHLTKEDQLTLKQQHMLDCLADAGVVPERVRSAVAGSRLFYRRKARLGVRWLANGEPPELLVGFRESYGSRVARVGECVILAPPFHRLLTPLRKVLSEISIPHAIPQLEIAVGDDAAQLILRHLEPLTSADVRLLEAFESRSRVTTLLQSGGYDSVRRLDGSPPEPLHYRLERHGLVLEFRAEDFVQVNAEMNEKLIDQVLGDLALGPTDQVLELFCGIGNFSLPVARKGATVLGVEGSAELIARARRNASLNGLDTRARFLLGDLYDDNYELPNGGQFNKALVDPPRTGCGAALPSLCAAGFERLVYVSCNPQSFAADARALIEGGYNLKDVGVFDMFPHTSHVETIGVFTRSFENASLHMQAG
jgi:23S rRNA (uracil1939-C5)-methyltransferase